MWTQSKRGQERSYRGMHRIVQIHPTPPCAWGRGYLWRGGVLHPVRSRLVGRRAHRYPLEVVVHPDGQGTLNDVLHA